MIYGVEADVVGAVVLWGLAALSLIVCAGKE